MALEALNGTIIDRQWEAQTGAQIILDVLAVVRQRRGVDIQPDESIVYLTTPQVGWQGRYYTARAIIDRMAELYGVSWHVTDNSVLRFTRNHEGESPLSRALRMGMAYRTPPPAEEV